MSDKIFKAIGLEEVDPQAKKEEKNIVSSGTLLDAIKTYDRWPFWVTFWSGISFIIALLVLFVFELCYLHNHIQLFINKDFLSNSYINSAFLLGLLTLSFTACGGTIVAIYKFLNLIADLRIQARQ